MAVKITRGDADESLRAFVSVLEGYETDHPGSEVELYRQNLVSIRVRVVDPAFRGLDKPDRHERVWHYRYRLPEEVQGDLSMLVTVTPDEAEKSYSSMEFQDPTPSRF